MKFLQLVMSMLLGGVLCASVCAEPAAEADPAATDAGLEGVWSVTSLKSDGQSTPSVRGKRMRFVFSKSKLTLRIADNVVAETEYSTDSGQSPPTIRLVFQGQPTLGIYELSGDDLTICLSGSPDKRPTAFVSEADSPNRMLFVLNRGDLDPAGWQPMVMNADGTGARPLAELPKDVDTGSPDWSPDGKRIAFDAWRIASDHWEPTDAEAHVYVVGADGTGLADLGDGTMPSWSPDAKRITFCRFRPNQGVWVMDADGKNRKLIDPKGLDSDWSPVANKIVYSRFESGAAVLVVVDPDSGQTKTIRPERTYRDVYWNPSWAPDGKAIAIVGRLPGGTSEVAVVSTEGEGGECRVMATDQGDSPYKAILPYVIAWKGNPDAILSLMLGPDDKLAQIYRLDPEGKRKPERIAGQDPEKAYVAVAWSPDGKKIVFIAGKP